MLHQDIDEFSGLGAREVVTLRDVAFHRAQPRELLARLDPERGHLKAVAMRGAQRRPERRCAMRR
jgi:hypothetical protein